MTKDQDPKKVLEEMAKKNADQSEKKLTSPASLAVDAVLVIGFFLYMYTVVSKHVPSNDKSMILLWGALCSACMTGVFWLAIQMFRVVLRAHLADRRK